MSFQLEIIGFSKFTEFVQWSFGILTISGTFIETQKSIFYIGRDHNTLYLDLFYYTFRFKI